ncbi:MAG: response regulator [Candidatus Izimaplasma sp.]|nr:response regulator [Candidatus Izimaplasma bacterium]
MAKTYNIILVDDEDEIRGRIASKISSDIGFNIVGSAGNGHDALELIEEKDVDVVLTDIKMPFVDGIELTRIIRRDYPMIKVAFITGYDEFNYAKEAVSLQVDNYIMKPISSKEINMFLKDLKKNLDSDYKQMKDIMVMKEKYEELLPIIGDSYLSSLINLDKISEEGIKKLSLYGIDVSNQSNFTTALVSVNSKKTSLKSIERIKINTNEMFKKVFKSIPFKHTLLVADGIVFIFSLETYEKNKADELLFELSQSSKEFLESGLLIGVSNKYSNFEAFPKSYNQAKRALSYANLFNYNNIVFAEELYNAEIKQSFISISDFNSFDRLIQYGKEEMIKEKTNELKERIIQDKSKYIREYVIIELSSLLINLAEQAKIPLDEITNIDLVSELNIYTRYEEMIDYFLDIILKIREQDTRKQLSHSEELTQRAIDYIKQNYPDPSMSLEQLSQELNVSISYLSMLFKKHSGYTFSKYLIKMRMDKAKELLKTSDLKIVDISVKVGYKDVYYFSHSFKKVTGSSPREYRNHEMV